MTTLQNTSTHSSTALVKRQKAPSNLRMPTNDKHKVYMTVFRILDDFFKVRCNHTVQ